MANLYGIETEDDCRERIDELLEMHRRAEQAMDKDTIAALKSRVKEYYKQRSYERMSDVERAYFWPAIEGAYVKAPNLASRQTWRTGLYEIEWNLRYYRPAERAEEESLR